MFTDDLMDAARRLLDRFERAGATLATAESCTGGLVAAAITRIAGSSAVLDRGFVTYSNAAKMDMLGVPERLLQEYGAVSVDVADAMVRGALNASAADVALSITGVAGPGGGSPYKPVGLVYIAAGRRGCGVTTIRSVFLGDRDAVRTAAAITALSLARGQLPG